MSYEKMILQQDLGFVRPKYIVQEGLKNKIAELGTLATRFDVSLEYPKRETQQNTKTGQTEATRKIVVKKVTSSPAVQGIGNVYTSGIFRTGADLKNFVEAEGIGQVDNHTLEISVWTPDSKDRDLLIDLIKIWMLELTHTVEQSSGIPFFLRKGILAVNEVRNYEGIDRNAANVQFNTGIIVYNLLVPFYGTHLDTLEHIKFNIVSNLTGHDSSDTNPGNSTDPGPKSEVITVGLPSPTPPGAGGGGGSTPVGSTDETPGGKVPETYTKREEIRPPSGTNAAEQDIVKINNPPESFGSNNDTVVIKSGDGLQNKL